ncbi:MAG: Clp protease ClpP [Oscillospiraceae bacterium]|nr:Clp protease ClpP [Oscillospiraceae bacterium]
MPQITKTPLIPYNIVVNTEANSAEINMYGEVVQSRPVDWWTGEPIPGNFIAQDEFLRDLEELSGKDSITVHINSVGGDMYAGIAIYNRLKGLAAKVTTINDGLAASAGSLIFMAGDTRKVNAGSNLMIHGAAGFLYGYYQVQDLNSVKKQLEAHNKAGINIYAEATGKDKDTIKNMVDKETWLTGADAVEAGFADEVIGEDTPVSMSLTPDKAHLIVNGVAMSARGLTNIPAGIEVMPTAPVSNAAPVLPVDNNNPQNQTRSEEEMPITNVDELRAAHPDLVAQVENAARTEGANNERARIQGIEAIQNAIADQTLITDAKFGTNPLTAEQLAFKAMQAQAAIGNTMLNNMAADANASGVANVAATPNAGPEVNVGNPDDAKAAADEAVALFNKMNGGNK